MAAVYGAVENVMDSMGMMRGDMAYPKRALFGAAVGYAAVETFRPSIMYYDDGTARPWSFSAMGATIDNQSKQQHSTWLPWWSGPLAGAVVFSQMI